MADVKKKSTVKVTKILFWCLIALIIIIPVIFLVVKHTGGEVQVASSEKFEKVFAELKDYDDLNLVSKQAEKDNLLSQLDEVITDYPNTIAARRALFYKGYVAYFSGDYTESKKSFTDFIVKNKKMYLTGKAYYFLSYVEYEQGNVDESIKNLDAICSVVKDSYYAPLAYYRLGQLYEEKGDKDKALKNYTTVIDSYADSSQVASAKIRVMMIKNGVQL